MRVSEAELKERAVLRLKGVKAGKPLIGPEIVQLHVTNKCNLSCQYCFYHSPLNQGKGPACRHFPFNKFKEIIRDCVDLRANALYFSGEGEPTMHPRFFDMLSFLRPLPLTVTVFSNGTFPLKRCRDLVMVDRIKINLGETDPVRYRALQGRDLFDRVTGNIRELVRLRKTLNPDLRIEIAFIVNRLNVASEARARALGEELGVDCVQRIVAESSPDTHCLSLKPWPAKRDLKKEKWVPCFHGWYYALVRLDGKVNVCCEVKRVVIADLSRTSFKEAWGSEAYARVRKMALLGKFRAGGEDCRDCRETERNRRVALKLVRLRNTK
jgi:MoaA/NifB/PqqE/SkfB family radical SAM enzyme